MKNITRTLSLISIALLFSPLALGGDSEGGTSKRYQHDMDIVRLNDLKVIGAWIEEYKRKLGHYPLQGLSSKANYVLIATREQQQYIRGGPPQVHITTNVRDFIAVLEKGLGRKIELPFEPQRRAVNKPAFYIYMIQGQTYYLAVHLHNEYSFTRKVADFYYKAEIGNEPYIQKKIWSYKALMNNPDYKKAVSRKMYKPGYIKNLRARIRKEGAF